MRPWRSPQSVQIALLRWSVDPDQCHGNTRCVGITGFARFFNSKMQRIYFYRPNAWIFLLALLNVPDGFAHDRCTLCHIQAVPATGAADIVSPLPQLCIRCHPDRVGNTEHVIDVPVTAAMTAPLPLLNGKVTCTTCHDPHSKSPALVRYDKDSLCVACHHN